MMEQSVLMPQATPSPARAKASDLTLVFEDPQLGSQRRKAAAPSPSPKRKPLTTLAGNGTETPRDTEARRTPKRQPRRSRKALAARGQAARRSSGDSSERVAILKTKSSSPIEMLQAAEAKVIAREERQKLLALSDATWRKRQPQLSATPRKLTQPPPPPPRAPCGSSGGGGVAQLNAEAAPWTALERQQFEQAVEQGLASRLWAGDASAAWDALAAAVGDGRSVADVKSFARTYMQPPTDSAQPPQPEQKQPPLPSQQPREAQEDGPGIGAPPAQGVAGSTQPAIVGLPKLSLPPCSLGYGQFTASVTPHCLHAAPPVCAVRA
jgi:hypothetical protein